MQNLENFPSYLVRHNSARELVHGLNYLYIKKTYLYDMGKIFRVK